MKNGRLQKINPLWLINPLISVIHTTVVNNLSIFAMAMVKLLCIFTQKKGLGGIWVICICKLSIFKHFKNCAAQEIQNQCGTWFYTSSHHITMQQVSTAGSLGPSPCTKLWSSLLPQCSAPKVQYLIWYINHEHYINHVFQHVKGRHHGKIDIGLSVLSFNKRKKKIDIDAEDFVCHIRVSKLNLINRILGDFQSLDQVFHSKSLAEI